MFCTKRSISVLLFFIYTLNSTAQDHSYVNKKVKTIISPINGLSFTHLQFNIAATKDGGTPNILSEIIWKKNLMYHYGVESSLFYGQFNLNSSLIFGTGLSGDVTDTDYAEDNRTSPFFEGKYSSRTSSMKSIKINVGYQLNVAKNFIIRPSFLLNLNWKKFMILNSSHLNESDDKYELGLKSYYKMNDPNYGARLNFNFLLDRFLLQNYFGAGLMNMRAYGNWNLRDDLKHPKSYEQSGNGWCLDIGSGIDFKLSSLSTMFIHYDYHYQNLKNGDDKLYRNDNKVLVTRLNENVFHQHCIMIGANFSLLR